MKIRKTFEFSNDERKALALHYGDKGMASRETIRRWIEAVVEATMQEIASDYYESKPAHHTAKKGQVKVKLRARKAEPMPMDWDEEVSK